MKTTKIAVYLNAVARKVKPFQISQWTYTFKPKKNQITSYTTICYDVIWQ